MTVLSDIETAILEEALRRTLALPSPVGVGGIEGCRLRRERDYGPAWNAKRWFPGCSATTARACYRALVRLESLGLIERSQLTGRGTTHVKLTEAGRLVVEGN